MFLPERLPLRQQAQVRNDWLRQRLNALLPDLMARCEIDLWLIIAREYNEDPVIMSLLPEPAMSARRRTMLAFCRNENGTVDCLTLSRYGYEGFYESAWNPDEDEDQYAALARLVRERNPQRIGLNHSQTFAFADGLSHTEHALLAAALGDDFMARTVSAEPLAVGWLEARLPEELAAYSRIVALGHAIIAQAFSTQVIHPGITTTEDVIWWMRQTMHDAGLRAWFQPSIAIQAPGQRYDDENPRTVIQPGDLLWCDMGFNYLGLCTDQQQHAYVLKPGETNAPQGLQLALNDGNRLQDILMEAMVIGRTGNQVLHAALLEAKNQGITGQIYTHPLGYHGHAAGPTIGLWDKQQGVPGAGDYPLYDNTAYSIELNARYEVPEWGGQDVRIALEEDAALVKGRMQWLDGRQTALYLIG